MDGKKRKIDESYYKRPDHFNNLLSMWEQGDFCDVTIQVGDQTYPAHKVILVANIPYFRNMFRHDFLEKNKGTISISGVSPQHMKTIIQFAYTGIIFWEDVQDLPSLIKDADFLGLEDVKNEAIKFFEGHFDYTIAIEAYHLSTMVYSSSLRDRSRKIIQKNFETVSKTDEFLRLNFDEIKDILTEQYSELHTHVIFKGVLRWIEHAIVDRYSNLEKLCSWIQIGNADFHAILEIVNEASYWSKLRQSKNLKSEIERYYQKSKDILESGENVRNRISGIIICNEKNPKKIVMYNPALDKWEEIQSPGEQRTNFRIAVSNYHLFIIGGDKEFKSNSTERQIKMYTTVENKSLNLKNSYNCWKQTSPLGTERRWFGIISVPKYIFVCGGINEDGALNSVERYTIEADTWTYVAPMKIKRHSFSIAALDNYLYAIGGTNHHNEFVSEIERYDLRSNCWKTLSSRLIIARRDFGVAVLNKKIYVCGGVGAYDIEDEDEELNSVEVFDPSTNECEMGARMPQRRYNLFVVSHAGKLWAIGGENEDQNISTIIEYDPEMNKWSEIEREMESIQGEIVGCTF